MNISGWYAVYIRTYRKSHLNNLKLQFLEKLGRSDKAIFEPWRKFGVLMLGLKMICIINCFGQLHPTGKIS